ncbi:unnamed protein product [Heligmosomoides polygyrus]|uniref:Uncharacterized protein n=1 Tax=Heligmosomoides polygyrus TaxID=6339 RepID=A0A183FH27_HELPZ|nr:unnamed protein product [Heligmosomoides polygyrus]
MESDGLSASDLMESFGESTSDRGIFGQWVKHPRNFNRSHGPGIPLRFRLGGRFKSDSSFETEWDVGLALFPHHFASVIAHVSHRVEDVAHEQVNRLQVRFWT